MPIVIIRLIRRQKKKADANRYNSLNSPTEKRMRMPIVIISKIRRQKKNADALPYWNK